MRTPVPLLPLRRASLPQPAALLSPSAVMPQMHQLLQSTFRTSITLQNSAGTGKARMSIIGSLAKVRCTELSQVHRMHRMSVPYKS